MSVLTDRYPVCGYNDLVPAILERNEARLRKSLITCDPNHQSAATGLTPVHFAVTWPTALTALVKIGVDVNVQDHSHRRPIHLAAALGASEAVKILLEGDCALWTHKNSLPLLQEALQGKNEQTRDRIAKLIITAYIDRYTRFFNLTLSVLPQQLKILSGLVPGRIQENLVPQIQKDLKRYHCHIPPALELRSDGSSVYETADFFASNRLSVQMAEALWEGGFQQIHEYSDRGTTPLLESWYNADFEIITWLISKGASPFSRHNQTQGSGLHLYAHRLGFPGGYFNRNILAVSYDKALISQLESDLGSRRDSCRCLCSVEGCLPVTIFLKWNHDLRDMRFHGERSSAYQVYFSQLRLFWEKLPPTRDDEQVCMEAVLRFLVFERMNLKHQCCRLGQTAEDKRLSETARDKNSPESECEMEARLCEYREKMRDCECELLEKPLCVVLRDHCKSL